MNHSERRRAAARDRTRPMNPLFEAFARTYVCPDCCADVELVIQDGVHILAVRHDDTCPAYRAMEERERQ